MANTNKNASRPPKSSGWGATNSSKTGGVSLPGLGSPSKSRLPNKPIANPKKSGR